MCLLPTWRDVQRALGARRSVRFGVAQEFVMHAGADEPRGALADIAAKHGKVVRVVQAPTHTRGKGQLAGHDIIGLEVSLVRLDADHVHENPGFKATGDISRYRAGKGHDVSGG